MELRSKHTMRASLTVVLTILGLGAAQHNVHLPVLHQNGGSSYQSTTFFGRGAINHHPFAKQVTAHEAVAAAAPVPTFIQPQQHRVVYTQPTVYQPVVQARQPIQPVRTYPQVPAYPQVLAHQPVRAYQPAKPVRVSYQPAQVVQRANSFNPDPKTYTYDPTKSFGIKEFPLDVAPEVLVDDALYQIAKVGPKVVSSIRTIVKNKLIGKFLAKSDSAEADPCTIISEDLDVTVDELMKATTSSRQELIDIITAVQEIKRVEKDPAAAITAASKAVSALDPLIPKFSAAFKANEKCDNKLRAAIQNFDQVGNILSTLGRTNLATSDEAAKRRITQGGQASKVISRVTNSLEQGGFTNLCPDSPNFSGQVFSGVGELLGGLKDIIGTFGSSQKDVQSLDDTVQLIKEGAVRNSSYKLSRITLNKSNYSKVNDSFLILILFRIC